MGGLVGADGGDGNDTLSAIGSSAIYLDGNDGDDRIDLTGRFNSSFLNFPSEIFGGRGDDTIAVDVDGLIDLYVSASRGNDIVDITVNGDVTSGTDHSEVDISGGRGNDTIETELSGVIDATISGGRDNDFISVTARDEVFVNVLGDDGNDTIVATAADDAEFEIEGGEGNDFIDLSSDPTSSVTHFIWGDSGNDTIHTGDADDEIYGETGNDLIVSAGGDDSIEGDNGNDTITAGAGNDTIDGGGGLDTLILSGNASDYNLSYDGSTLALTITDLRSGSPDGTDTVLDVEFIQFADSTLDLRIEPGLPPNRGPTFIEILGDLAVNERVDSGGSIGTAYDPAVARPIIATLEAIDPDAIDTFTYALSGDGYMNFEVINGNQITVREGANIDAEERSTFELTVTATDSGNLTRSELITIFINDYSGFYASSANAVAAETINGTSEEDEIVLDAGDIANGGLGNDTITSAAGPVSIDGGGGNDSLVGSTGNDSLDGGHDDDTLTGGEGNDWIVGGTGNNTLSGDGGSDTLTGGYGNDLMNGGSGSDTFVFDNAFFNGTVSVQDFGLVDGPDKDVIHIIDGVITGFADLQNAWQQTASGVEFTLLSGGTVTIAGVNTGDLNASHFRFGLELA